MLKFGRKAKGELGQFGGGGCGVFTSHPHTEVAKQSISLNAQQWKGARCLQEGSFLTILSSPRKPDLNKTPDYFAMSTTAFFLELGNS